MILEKVYNNPVLFPDEPSVVDLNTRLLLSASFYDANNPNLISKLVPKHYLLEQAEFEGFQNEDGNIADGYTGDTPGGGKLGSPQIVAALLFTWAKYFDEMKLYLDQFSNLLHVDYDDEGTVADQFLPFLGEYHGFSLPNMFSNASLDQLVEGSDLGVDASNSTMGLQTVQNQIWRRILVNLNEIVQSKGTVHSIKALMRSAGISPDDIGISSLVQRAQKEETKEVILAMNATIDGQTTAYYITDQLATAEVKVSRLARGVPVGGELDYMDDGTLLEAIEARQPF